MSYWQWNKLSKYFDQIWKGAIYIYMYQHIILLFYLLKIIFLNCSQTQKLEEENDHLHQAVKDKDEYIVAAKASIREKEQTVTKQREELMKLKRQLADVKETNEALMEERKDDFKKLNKDKQLAVDEMKEVMKREQRLVLEQV